MASMTRIVLVATTTLTALLLLAATAAARAPVTHPQDRGWVYAANAAQTAANWMFPRAGAPLGAVIDTRGCDRQSDGNVDCYYDLAMYSNGHWTGRQPPTTVEVRSCDAAIDVTIRRLRNGSITTSSNYNPCRPDEAPNETAAALLFAAAIHRRKPQVGRIHGIDCAASTDVDAPSFSCSARTHRARLIGGVSVSGDVVFGLPAAPAPAPAATPSQSAPPPG